MKYFLMMFLFIAPLSAQQRDISIVPAEQVNNITIIDSTVVNVNVMTDSTMLARLNENLEALRTQIAEPRCSTCGGASTTTKFAVGVLIPTLIWIALELRGIKNSSNNDMSTDDSEPKTQPHENSEHDD